MRGEKTMQVGVCIVNYKTMGLTIDCLRSLDGTGVKVIVIDNDSQDGSYEKISAAIVSEEWSGWASIKASGRNGGFAYGNNVAIREFLKADQKPEYIYLLNPDTVVRKGAVSQLVKFMQNNPAVGIAGSQIEDENGQALPSAFKFHTWQSEMNKGFSLGLLTKLLRRWVSEQTIPKEPIKTDWVSGASMMIRREVFEQVGLLDDTYFMYFEETDFCLQAAKKGWECWYVPSSRVMHLVGQSTGISHKKMQKRMPVYWFESRRRYFLKNFGALYAAMADMCWLVGFSTWKLRNIVQRKEDNHPPGLFTDFLLNSVFFRGFTLLPVKK
jgi:N-acetylglucosaminyl-diphospho-decaprenol L-rhamnosyltransferase